MKTNCSSKLARGQKISGLLFAGLFILLSGNVMAQKNMIGIYGSGEWAQGYGLKNISGLTYERKFTNHFGIETGLQFHRLKYTTTYLSGGEKVGVNRNYINLPVLFKYYSNIVNVSAGPTLNMLIHENKIGGSYDNFNIIFPRQKNLAVGYKFKLSKSFNIKDKFVLEPEISIGNRFEFKKPSFGIGASFKYKF